MTDRMDEVWTTVGDKPMFFGRDGQPLTLREFSTKFEDAGYKILARTAVGDVTVVTAWLGTDQGFGYDNQPPQIFGTIVELADGTFEDLSEQFSATEAEAFATHSAKVEQLSPGVTVTI